MDYGIIINKERLITDDELPKKNPLFQKVNYFINGAIETIIDSLTFISDEKKGIYVNLMKKQYNLFSNESIDVFSKNGLSRLANLLEEDYNIYHDITPHMNIVLEFTSFIKFHSEDILNEQLKIVD